mgnify:CR=1 FL=1
MGFTRLYSNRNRWIKMKKEKFLIEITYCESGKKEVIKLKTDDLAWSMVQYQRNRLPLVWEIIPTL